MSCSAVGALPSSKIPRSGVGRVAATGSLQYSRGSTGEELHLIHVTVVLGTAHPPCLRREAARSDRSCHVPGHIAGHLPGVGRLFLAWMRPPRDPCPRRSGAALPGGGWPPGRPRVRG